MSDDLEFRALLENWHAGTMTDAGKDRFEKLLDDPALRRELVRDFVDDALLADALKEEAALDSGEASAQPRIAALIECFANAARMLWRPRLVFAGASLALAAGALLYTVARNQRPVVASLSGANVVRDGRVLEKPEGAALRAGDLVQTNSNGRAQLRYRDGTTVDLDSTALAKIGGSFTKQFELKTGSARLEAAPQPGFSPLTVQTADARVTIAGARVVLTAFPGAAWLNVDRGAARFSPAREPASEEAVSAGQYAVISGNLRQPPLAYDRKASPPSFVAIPIDWKNSSVRGDGNWRIDKEEFSQQKLSAGPDCPVLWSTPGDPTSRVELDCPAAGSVLITCEIQVDSLPDEGWYGIALRMGSEGRLAKLHFIGNGPIAGKLQATMSSTAQSGEELGLVECAPFHLGRYHMTMLYARLDDEHVRISGKLWTGSREPEAWMVQGETPLADAVRRFGLETTHCACTFRDFKAMLVR